MPKVDIDYSNTIIYKIYCKNPDIKHIYVGHTTNFVQRKHGHKQCCANAKTDNYSSKLYKTIRNNGGWDNWTMEILNFFNCADHYEARKKEQEYFILLNADLNSIEPMPIPKNKIQKNKKEELQNNLINIKMPKMLIQNASDFYCENCDFKCNKQSNYNTHLTTPKHTRNISDKKNSSYSCNECGFKTGNKNDYNRHLLTAKHKLRLNSIKSVKKTFCCINCSKEYKSQHGLWYHNKKCIKSQNTIEKEHEKPQVDSDIINQEISSIKVLMLNVFQQNTELTKQNSDLINKILELTSIPSSINNSTNNSHNKQFNLQVFLNEECKNAMTMTDFINSLEIKNEELENMGKLGWVDGISNIFIRGLNELDEKQRPLHCTDKKRETLFIKEKDGWNKDEKKDKIKIIIGQMVHKNFKKIPQWTLDNPSCHNSETKKHQEYMRMVNQVMTGTAPDDEDGINGINKIIKRVSGEVCIEKNSAVL